MRRLHCIVLFLISLMLLASVTSLSWGIPVFARKYDFKCTMCHVQFPKLSDFGQSFRDNGYRIMGKEDQEKTVFETPVPVALRTSAGYNNEKIDNPGGDEADVNSFQLNGLDILSAGLFSSRLGYMVIYVPELKGSRNVAAQDGSLEMANVVYSLRNAPAPFTIRFGRFEPAYVAFSAKRTLTAAPYTLYDYAGSEGFALSDTQNGVEFAAVVPWRIKLAGGWVNGSDDQPVSDCSEAYYVRASKTFGRGEGQVVGHRIGGFAYFGKSRLGDGTGTKESIQRFGADLTFNFWQTSIMGQYLTGKDDAALNVFDPTNDYKYSGAFVEVNHSFPYNMLGFARFGKISTPSEQDQDIDDWTVGVRYYPAMNVAFHAEYSTLTIGHGADDGSSDLKDKMFTFRVDFAF